MAPAKENIHDKLKRRLLLKGVYTACGTRTEKALEVFNPISVKYF